MDAIDAGVVLTTSARRHCLACDDAAAPKNGSTAASAAVASDPLDNAHDETRGGGMEIIRFQHRWAQPAGSTCQMDFGVAQFAHVKGLSGSWPV